MISTHKYISIIVIGIILCSLIYPNVCSTITGTLFKRSSLVGNPDDANWEFQVNCKVSCYSWNNKRTYVVFCTTLYKNENTTFTGTIRVYNTISKPQW